MFSKLRALAFLVLSLTTSVSAAASCPDLTLVLAIDSSSSIDADEFVMETEGYAQAFRNPGVLQALSDAGTVDVAVVFWAGLARSTYIMPWIRITSEADALAVSDWFLAATRKFNGDTEIGNGLRTALDLIDHHETCGLRRVVDVSGDGRAELGSSRGPPRMTLKNARARADGGGVTVNGLAIANEEPTLGQYYREELITGPGCFSMEVSSFNDFGTAIVEKLKRELRSELVASLPSGQP